MSNIEIGMLVFVILATLAMGGLVFLFIWRFSRYKYVGNVYLYIVLAYLICLAFSIFVNLNPIQISEAGEPLEYNVSFANKFVAIATSPFDALKMMAIASDRALIKPYFEKSLMHGIFGGYYYAASAFALVSTSITVILFFAKSVRAKLSNWLKSWFKDANVYYIFSEAKVANAAKRLGHVLQGEKDKKKKNHNIVIMYVSKASLKTQEGTEYRDALINDGFDVKNETFSEKLSYYLFKKFFNRNFRHFLWWKKWPYHNRKITVYGIFDDDDSAIELASNFRVGIARNEFFYKHYVLAKYLPDGSNINLLPKHADRIEERRRKFYIKQEKRIGGKYHRKLRKIYLETEPNKNDNPEITANKLKDREDRLKALYEEDKAIRQAKVDALLSYLNRYRIFVTFQDADIDLAHNFSGQTLHIINTLSQYDMVSSEFLLNNQIVDFLDKDPQGNMILDETNKDAFHVSFFGLGSINRPIFEKMTYAYQLWPDKTHKMHYHIYDYRAYEIVEQISNEYTVKVDNKDPKFFEKPQLYSVEPHLEGKDLTSYEILLNHFTEIKNKKGDKRFNPKGLEIFVISARSTNADIQIAISLRRVLIKLFSVDELKKTYIFVRIGNKAIADNLMHQGSEKDRFIHDQDYLVRGRRNLKSAPIIIFGQNTNMADFINNDYDRLINLGKASYASYCGYSQAEVDLEWLKLTKREVMENTATTYSLKTKLAILGYNLKDWVIYDKDNKKVVEADYQTNLNKERLAVSYSQRPDFTKPIMHLAGLEHNRWLATSYVIHKYGQLEKEEFIKLFSTKAKEKTLNVCMTTNDGLHKLFEYGKDQGWDEAKAEKTCFGYDINAMEKMFAVLFPKEETKKDKRRKISHE